MKQQNPEFLDDISYLSLLPKPLDSQQDEACRSTTNTVVAAGAGSGKTQVLATRFAWLVMSVGIKANRILTLTFTKKAAAEMYERIYSYLSFFAGLNENSLSNKQWPNQLYRAKVALADLSSAHIQTLDSYCSFVVRQAANRYGIRPDFTTGSSDVDRLIKNIALPFVLKNCHKDSIQAISSAGRIQETAESLFADIIISYTSLADDNNFFNRKIDKQTQIISDAWNKNICGRESALEEKNLPLQSIVSAIQYEIENISEDKKNKPYCKELEKIMRLYDSRFIFKVTQENIISCDLITQVQEVIDWIKKFSFNQSLSGYTKSLREIVNNSLNKKTGLILKSLGAYITQFPFTKELYSLLDDFLTEVNNLKRQSGKLTFKDISEMALKILSEQDDIRIQERDSYDRIMIDEFQDNNSKNRDMLFLLSKRDDGEIENNKLFFVGDEKQSIYKFRGAEVSVFNQLKIDLTKNTGKMPRMIYNYRSTPEIIEAVNRLFGGYCMRKKGVFCNEENKQESWIFPEKATEPYEAEFSAETIACKVKNGKELAPIDFNTETNNIPLHVCLLNKGANELSGSEAKQYLTPKDQIAYYISQKINELVTNGYKYSDIAILDRSRTNRSSLERNLSRANIPFSVDQNKNLFNEAPVNDIYFFLRLCVYPSDKNAFAAYISSPFSGLDYNAIRTVLVIFLLNMEKNDVLKPFDPSKDKELEQLLSIEDYEKYQSAAERYKEIAFSTMSSPLTQTITKLWYEYGYRYEYAWSKKENLFNSQYDMLFELARQTDSNQKSVAWFIDQLAQKKANTGSFKDESDIDVENLEYAVEEQDAVQIMTIHKSKGLEFPVVFILGCTDIVKAEVNKERFFYDEETGVSFRFNKGESNYFFESQRNIADKIAEAEFRRLIYVAVTRARDQAYFFGAWNITAKNDSKAKPSIMSKIINYYYKDLTLEYDFSTNAPFDYSLLIPVKKNDAFISSSDTEQEKDKRKEQWKLFIQNAQVEIPPEPLYPYTTPSSLESNNALEDPALQASNNDAPFYPELRKIISITKSVFDYNNFGTLVHSYMEVAAKAKDLVEIDDSFFESLELTPVLQDKTLDKAVKEICRKMVYAFYTNTTGKDFLKAREKGLWYKAEYGFKSFIQDQIVTGSIDLIYKTLEGRYKIIDYKSDTSINPDNYKKQIEYYRISASQLLNVPIDNISCSLYYLRWKKEIPVF